MKRKLLSFALLIISLSTIMTLINCGGDEPAPCVAPAPPTVKKTITIDAGGTISLTASLVDLATYKWTGPNNFSSTEQNPTINSATEDMTGEYKCVITVNGCNSNSASTFVAVRGLLEDPRDGNKYKTIKIGTQTWMAQNLNWQDATYYADWKVYGNVPNNGKVYGALYNYKLAVKAAAGITGWRVPTDDDWKTLVDYLGGYQVAGSKLKEEGTAHWVTPNAGTTNTSGFTALGAGYYDAAIGNGFQDLLNRTYFWTSTPYSSYMVIYRVQSEDFWAVREYGDKANYYSIRLVKIP